MKKLTRKELISRIDRLFQACRRFDGAKKKGDVWYNRCVTSDQVLPMSKIQAGHWIPRGCYATRWDPTNCNPQSAHDNLYKSGAYIEYSKWYLDKYGLEKYNQMIETYTLHKQGKIPPFSIQELRDFYNHWLKEGRALENKVGPLFPKSWALEIDFIE